MGKRKGTGRWEVDRWHRNYARLISPSGTVHDVDGKAPWAEEVARVLNQERVEYARVHWSFKIGFDFKFKRPKWMSWISEKIGRKP